MPRSMPPRTLSLALAAGLLLCGAPGRGSAFSIERPENMAVVEPGRPIPVTVDLGADIGVRLLAVADVTGGRLGAREEFDEVLVRAEPAAGITRIEFEVEKPWRLQTIGWVLEVPVVAQFDDGVLRRIGGGSAGSTYALSNEGVGTIRSNGLLRIAGNGRATITVTNRGKQGRLEVIVTSAGRGQRVAHRGSGSRVAGEGRPDGRLGWGQEPGS